MNKIKILLISSCVILFSSAVNSQNKDNNTSKNQTKSKKMNQKIKEEALEQIEQDVLMGFETQDDMFESISEMFYDVDDFDEDWLKKIINEKFNQHKKESLKWVKPTAFDRLVKSFDYLTLQKIVGLHNAGYTKQDAIAECEEAIDELKKRNIDVVGYCYYHEQDIGGAIDKSVRKLYIGFGSVDQEDAKTLIVGNTIIKVLKENNFEVEWDGTVNQRITIINIDWKKIPDNETWGVNRVIQILTSKRK